MNHILGLIDSLEATILDGNRIPFSEKIIIDERRILLLIDKLRMAIKKGDNFIRESVENSTKHQPNPVDEPQITPISTSNPDDADSELSDHLVQTAKEKALRIVKDAHEYSDYIMSNLQLMVTKMEKNMANIEKSIESTRNSIEKAKNEP